MCEYCKYNIVNEPFMQCVVCAEPTIGNESLCKSCVVPYERAWCVGERSESLKQLITDHKFNRVKSAYITLAGLLDQTVPQLPKDCIVVPVPTVSAHIRQRGYDHCALMAKQFARQRSLSYSQPLERVGRSTQRGANKSLRIQQAKQAFSCKPISGGRYILVDDVFTTGATVHYAAQELKNAGADEVWVAVVAHQPLEKEPFI